MNERSEVKEHYAEKSKKIEKWGEGPWIEEPDGVEWKYKGIQCFVKRNDFGALNGYCFVPKGHPFDQPMETHECFGNKFSNMKGCFELPIDVHGGITFGERTIDDRAVIGFDCSHSMDIAPGMENSMKEAQRLLHEKIPNLPKLSSKILERSYKDIQFVMGETERMVDQMLEYKGVLLNGTNEANEPLQN
jgi:hypothetical protein